MRKVRITIVIGTILAMIMCFLMCFTAAYRVDNMNVSDSRFYNDESILAAAGISEKSDMITFNAEKAEAAVRKACPYLRNVTVTCDYPNGIRITVDDEAHLLAASYGESYLVLSDELRVLDIVDDEESVRALDCISLSVPAFKTPEIGSTLLFADGRDNTYALNFMCAVLSADFGSEITHIDVAEKFNLSVSCGSHVLYFGSSSNMETKLQVAYNMIDEGVFSRYSSALCNISDPSGATVRENISRESVLTQPATTAPAPRSGAVG
ncbi:MAG: FtsQ-type POTRA domain-containing protein [Clostridia bacterium]|nr:FtsQ-type POTRA domain-containing protein [Clostridia bacterium]